MLSHISIISVVFYLDEVSKSRKPFSFAAYDMCVDEEYNHLYLSTRKNGIMRFRIVDTNYYFEDLTLDGCLDLSELYACRQSIQQQQQEFELFPTCLTLVEDESVFKDTVKTTKRRRLIFYDRTSKQIVSIQVRFKFIHCIKVVKLILLTHFFKSPLL